MERREARSFLVELGGQEEKALIVDSFYGLEQEEQKESIFNYYSIKNEALFLRRIKDLPLAERHFYIRENVLTFLGEFVGEVPYKKISYLLKEDGLDYAGVKVMETYRKTAQLAGRGSREWFETKGIERVEQAFLFSCNLPVNNATVISPPKTAPYGFVFHFVKGKYEEELGGEKIHEYILRYPEEKGDLEESRRILFGLRLDERISLKYQTLEDFLENPILAYSQELDFNLNTLLSLLGIDEEAINKAQRFERIVSQELSSWIGRYFEGVLRLSELELKSPEFVSLENELKLLFAAIYNKAKEIKERLEKEQEEVFYLETPPIRPKEYEQAMIYHYALSRPLRIEGGGSCPVTNSSGFEKGDFLSSFEIRNNLELGIPIERQFERQFEKGWSYHKGTCSLCQAKDVEVGPCNICKSCEKKFD